MNQVNVFTGSSGLNTVVDRVRLPFDPDTGMSDLAHGVNVTVDQSRRIRRRTGYKQYSTGVFHSLFCDGGDCVVAEERGSDVAIHKVAADLSLSGIRSGLTPGRRISFTQVLNDIYYSNGKENGVVVDGVSDFWPVDEYTGADSNRSFIEAPKGEHLAFAFGRIFIADGDTLWWSELYKYGLFDQARSWVKFGSKITMIKPVAGGLFVSDSKSTYFLQGNDPAKFIRIKVASYPAVEWSCAIDLVDGMEIGIEVQGLCALWASPEGACLGTPTGSLINLNKNKVVYPENVRQGAGLLYGYNYIHTMR